jgi:hypothetical protein
MANLIGGIGASHSPSIAFAYDLAQEQAPQWKPFFDSVAQLREQVHAARPDVLVFVYNDHLWNFTLDTVPTFAIGVAESFELAPERERARALPQPQGDPALAWHLTRALMRDEFDLTVCQSMMLDHGFFSVMPLLCEPPWPMRVVPIAVNVIQHPLPSPARCFKLGEAIGRAVQSYGSDERVMVVATGGLSHQLHGESFGYTNPQWDQRFMQLLSEDPGELLKLSHDDYMHLGGAESVEMIMWLVMRGALTAPRTRHMSHHAGLLTGLGLLHLENG